MSKFEKGCFITRYLTVLMSQFSLKNSNSNSDAQNIFYILKIDVPLKLASVVVSGVSGHLATRESRHQPTRHHETTSPPANSPPSKVFSPTTTTIHLINLTLNFNLLNNSHKTRRGLVLCCNVVGLRVTDFVLNSGNNKRTNYFV